MKEKERGFADGELPTLARLVVQVIDPYFKKAGFAPESAYERIEWHRIDDKKPIKGYLRFRCRGLQCVLYPDKVSLTFGIFIKADTTKSLKKGCRKMKHLNKVFKRLGAEEVPQSERNTFFSFRLETTYDKVSSATRQIFEVISR